MIKVGPKYNLRSPKEERLRETATEEEMGSVATGTKVETKRSQAEDWWQPPEAGKKETDSPTASRGRTAQSAPWSQPSESDFRLLASRMGRKLISVVWNHKDCNLSRRHNTQHTID